MSDLPSTRLLMGPGPSPVAPRVYAALGAPTLGHMDPAYFKVMDEVQQLLRKTFETQSDLTLALPVTGMGAMEAALINLLEPGNELLVVAGGVFGARMAEVAQRLGVQARMLNLPWGNAARPDQVADALKIRPVKLVAIVQGETSTGVLQTHLDQIAGICHERGAMLLVDAVASLGGCALKMDAWGLDAVYSGSQKCLSVPPGISPISFGERADKALMERKTKVGSWYLDLSMIRKYWNSERVYHHTGPVNMTFALCEGLRLVQEEGLEARIARHSNMARALHLGLEAMGLKLFVSQPAERLPTVTTVRIPDGAEDARIRRTLLERHGLEIGGGLGELKGKVWRIGLMGEGARPNPVLFCLAALGGALRESGIKIQAGAGVEAAAGALAGIGK